MESKIVTTRDILAAFAASIIRQSPYSGVENLPTILEDIRMYLISLDFVDENTVKDKYDTSLYRMMTTDEIYDTLKKIRDNVSTFNMLNITKVELDAGITDPNDENRSMKMSIIGRGIYTSRDRDFIDLDACIRNVYNQII